MKIADAQDGNLATEECPSLSDQKIGICFSKPIDDQKPVYLECFTIVEQQQNPK